MPAIGMGIVYTGVQGGGVTPPVSPPPPVSGLPLTPPEPTDRFGSWTCLGVTVGARKDTLPAIGT